ncbi:S66 peptidase family protein [Aquabacterium sp. OR-4]|uniref:S66 peptidase family protein n=1 Tax=Aquabacterium sp. OR-4 TaxID=2978127 RepID=UPI0028C935BC|nr:LD-carboxypeptidase [Aquabacterium sp. OR-4]MDT7836812.1 LD-carboxypeptidase [Aquabacterium sp. OR-4]
MSTPPLLHALAPGATLAIIAPAGPAAAERVAAVPALLQAQGWQARLYPGCHARHPAHEFLSGPDAQRLADLQAAFADPQVDAVWCLRGGHGSARLLPAMDVAQLARRPKLLIGYSDITALHLLLDRLGWPTLHAPMPASDLLLPGREADAQALFTRLRQGWSAGEVLAPPLLPGAWRVPGTVQGRLLGGNLSLLAALCGTPWQPRTEGALLFIEEVGEPAYRIDRCLLQLRLAGLLEQAAGFVLGSFTDGAAVADTEAVLREHLAGLGKPVLAGWPTGHGSPHQPLPLGVAARLDSAAGTLTLLQDFLRPRGVA